MEGTAPVDDCDDSERCGGRSVPQVTRRSVQPYRSQDEYVVVMKEDLAEWLNELYDTTITADDLFDRLETGILLCRYACTVDDAIKSRAGVQSEPVVYRERGVEPGSFQARVNVAVFLAWCRRAPLRMPDDVLFETGDLICQREAERNERQVALCLLEVGRRSAALRVGLPAPQLVRLEAEIDAEARRDDDAGLTTISDDDEEEEEEEESLSNSSRSLHSRTSPSTAAGRKSSRLQRPRVIVSCGVDVEVPPSVLTETPKTEKRGSVWQRRRYRPIIPVDMVSLDEMVREILSKCTCPNQYPMIRVSEGKYRIGDNLTLIFVRILRQHVMVRIGGGWNTLDNYLARCDPCRCQKNSASAAVQPTHTVIRTTTATATATTTTTTTKTTISSGQLATCGGETVDECRQPALVDGERLHLGCSQPLPPSSSLQTTMTTVTTTSGRQQPAVVNDLSTTPPELAASNVDGRPVPRRSPPSATHHTDTLVTHCDDVSRDSAADEARSSCYDDDGNVTCYSTSTPQATDSRQIDQLSTSSSLSLEAAAAAVSTPVDMSCSCMRQLGADDARHRSAGGGRTPTSRPSRIPLPLRVVAQCQLHGTACPSRGHVVDQQMHRSNRHKRCDSGVDLNLSSPDFD